MTTHRAVWAALDRLAEQANLAPSALARKAGLDATSFNRSKRVGADGRLRWPSSESLAKVLDALDVSFLAFGRMIDEASRGDTGGQLGVAEPGAEYEAPPPVTRTIIREVPVPPIEREGQKAFQVDGPASTTGEAASHILLAAPVPSLEIKDHVIIRTTNGELILGELAGQDEGHLDIRPINSNASAERIGRNRIEWIGRVRWSAQ